MIKGKVITGKLPDIASWERAKKNKIYPAGCTCLQVSATKGQLVYLYEDQPVESKYAVIIPDRTKVDPFFFYRLLQQEMPEFLSKEQTGLNIKPHILKRFPVQYFEKMEIQKYISAEQFAYEAEIRHQQEVVEMFDHLKRYLFQMMFC